MIAADVGGRVLQLLRAASRCLCHPCIDVVYSITRCLHRLVLVLVRRYRMILPRMVHFWHRYL